MTTARINIAADFVQAHMLLKIEVNDKNKFINNGSRVRDPGLWL